MLGALPQAPHVHVLGVSVSLGEFAALKSCTLRLHSVPIVTTVTGESGEYHLSLGYTESASSGNKRTNTWFGT